MAIQLEKVVLELSTDAKAIKLGLDEVIGRLGKARTASKNTQTGFSGLEQSWTRLASAFTAGALMEKAISGIVSFGTSTVEAAGQIVDLSDKTGLSIKAVQLYGAVAKQTGGDLSTYADSIFKLGINLSKGGDEVRSSVSALGLNFAKLRAMKPEEQFEAIAAALKNVTNEGDRNRMGVALFGKQWKDVAPGVVAGIDDIKNATVLASDAQVRAVDAWADAWDQALENAKNATISFLGDVATAMSEKKGVVAMLYSIFTGMPLTDAAMVGAMVNNPKQYSNPKGKGGKGGLLDEAEAKKQREDLDRLQKQIDAMAEDLSGNKLYDEMTMLADAIEQAGGASAVMASKLPDLVKKIDLFREAGFDLRPELEEIVQREKDVALAQMDMFDSPSRQRARDFVATLKDGGEKLEHDADVLRGIQASLDGIADTGRRLPFFDVPIVADMSRLQIPGATRIGSLGPAPPPTEEWRQFAGVLSGIDTAFVLMGRHGSQAWRNIAGAISTATRIAGDYATAMSNAKTEADTAAASSNLMMAGATFGLSLWLDFVVGMVQESNQLMANQRIVIAQLRELGSLPAPATHGPQGLFGLERDRADLAADQALLDRLTQASEAAISPMSALQDLLSNGWGVLPATFSDLTMDLSRMPGLTDAQREAIQRMVGEPSWEVEQKKAEQYGIALSSLGTSFNQRRLNDSFDSLFSDFTMFSQQGANMGEVLAGMSDEVNNVIQQSRQFGTLIPEYMRPMLQSMVEAGILLDANGEKLTDLSSFHFSESIESSFTRMADLLEVIVGLLGGTADEFYNVGIAAGYGPPLVRPPQLGPDGRPINGNPRFPGGGDRHLLAADSLTGAPVGWSVGGGKISATASSLEDRQIQTVRQYTGNVELNIAGKRVGEVLIEDILKTFENNAGDGRPIGPTTRLSIALGRAA